MASFNDGDINNSQNVTEDNRKYFNDMASTYDLQAQAIKMNEIVAKDLLRRRDWAGVVWDHHSTRVLDYACGTGLISRILAPYTKQIIGMDISEKMVESFNQKVGNQGIPSEEMRAIVADLCSEKLDPKLSDPQYFDFDVAVCGFAFHHFPNVPLATERIVERLKKSTGVLLIVDFKPHEPLSSHRHGNLPGAHTVTHAGFSQQDIRRWFEDAGLVEIDFVDAGPDGVYGRGVSSVGKNPETGEEMRVERGTFMAKGRRA
ncbi:hypothetical protein RUND412_010284 [Rhizina undulata]